MKYVIIFFIGELLLAHIYYLFYWLYHRKDKDSNLCIDKEGNLREKENKVLHKSGNKL